MDSEASLSAYSPEQVTKGEKLPEKISSIAHDVEAGEKLKLDLVTEQVGIVAQEIKGKTQEKFVVLGSMGMYATLNELRAGGNQLMLLEQRIGGGKNDYDIGVKPEVLTQVMTSFGWTQEAQKIQRGFVGKDSQMVDLMGRKELPHFPWRESNIEGINFYVQTPEEMIFEKISALVNPGKNDNNETRMREVKWGIDIKLLKTYLMVKNNWTETQVEAHLENRWSDYLEDTRYQGVLELAQQVDKGEAVSEVIKQVLKQRLGKDKITDPRQELLLIIDDKSATTYIDSLLQSKSGIEFSSLMKNLLDIRAGGKLDYKDATQKATQEYNNLLASIKE